MVGWPQLQCSGDPFLTQQDHEMQIWFPYLSMDRKTFLGAEDSYIMTGSYTISLVPDVHRYFHFCSFPKKGDKESHVACFLPILYLILTLLLAHLNYFIHHGFWSFFVPGRRWAIPSFYTIWKNPLRNHGLDAVGSIRSSPGKMSDLLRGPPGFRPGKLQRSGTGSPTR